MKSGEARIAEAITALTAVFEREGIDGAARKAHDFVTELLHQGWRATAPATHVPDVEHRANPETKQRGAR